MINIMNSRSFHAIECSLIKWSLTTIMLRSKEAWYCSIVARGSLRIWHVTSFLNIECKKYKNLLLTKNRRVDC